MQEKNNKPSGKISNYKIPSKKSSLPNAIQTTKQFSKEQELFLQLLRNYPDGVISIIDQKLNFIITGGELHKRLAVEPSALIGNEIYPKFPENIRKLIKAQLIKVFDGIKVTAFELPYIIKGEYYVMDAFPLKEKDGSIIHAGVIIRNITHLKSAEEELKKSLEKEKELSELKSRFITMASHEFRTPLSTVLTSVQLLKKYKLTGELDKIDKHIARIVFSVQVLDDILNDFLTVGKMQEGKLLSNPVQFDIKDQITMIIKELDNSCKEGQQICYKHSGNETILLDPLLFKPILTNILSNAIKFSPENSPLEVKTHWLNERLVLSVKDYGIGIPMEYRKHLFGQFYRASNATNIQGTGLGLYTVSKYVALMNGTICYTSKLEKGTEFIITF